MAEPTSTALSGAATLGVVSITALMPGVNGDALIGAFGGAVVFALYAKDIPISKRLIYLVISIAIGYLAEDEVLRWTGWQDSALAAFVASALVVTAALAGIDWLRKVDFSSFFRR